MAHTSDHAEEHPISSSGSTHIVEPKVYLIVYVALIWAYGRAMNRIDRDCGLAEDD